MWTQLLRQFGLSALQDLPPLLIPIVLNSIDATERQKQRDPELKGVRALDSAMARIGSNVDAVNARHANAIDKAQINADLAGRVSDVVDSTNALHAAWQATAHDLHAVATVHAGVV